MKNLLSEQELTQIRDAIAHSEAMTSGEIVPFIAPRSGRYDVAVWRGAGIGAITSLTLSMLVFQFYHGWGLAWLYTGWGTALMALLAGTVGAMLGAWAPPVTRLLAGQETMARAVHAQAQEAFIAEEVFATRDRTGILIFISLFERRIEVLGDTGINRLVSADDWVEVVERIREGIRRGKLAEGLVEALKSCGGLLEKAGLAARTDDRNELPDELRYRARKR